MLTNAALKKDQINELPLMISCGIIIEKEDKILLQRRAGENHWCIPGGIMQIGEKYHQAAARGVLEETDLTVETMQLFGMQSGRDCFVTNKFGEKAFNLQVIFHTTEFTGRVKIKDAANREHRFFKRTNLPKNLNPQQKAFIADWRDEKQIPIIN
ncbi:MAG: NUDIX domain-containing protein [Bacillus sp. (in: firmicutes)]